MNEIILILCFLLSFLKLHFIDVIPFIEVFKVQFPFETNTKFFSTDIYCYEPLSSS